VTAAAVVPLIPKAPPNVTFIAMAEVAADLVATEGDDPGIRNAPGTEGSSPG